MKDEPKVVKNILIVGSNWFLANGLVEFIRNSLGKEFCVESASTIENGRELLKNPNLLVVEITQNWRKEVPNILAEFSYIPDFDKRLILVSKSPLSLQEAKNKYFLCNRCIVKLFEIDEAFPEDLKEAIKEKFGLISKKKKY